MKAWSRLEYFEGYNLQVNPYKKSRENSLWAIKKDPNSLWATEKVRRTSAPLLQIFFALHRCQTAGVESWKYP